MTFTGDRSGMLRSRPRGDAEPATPASAAHDGAPRPGDVLELGTEAARPELAAVCTKGLARSPVERFRNGAAFSHALRAYLTDRGITYSPSDCATELRSLGLLAGAPDGLGAAATADDVSTAIANGEHIDKAAPAPGKAEQRRRSRPRVVASVAAAVAAAAILAAGSVKFHSRIPRPSAAPPSA